VLKGVEDLRKGGPARLVNGVVEWAEEDGLVKYQGRVYVPADKDLHRDVVKQSHDNLTSGHPGIHGTLERVQRQFWWPGMQAFVKKYVEGCEVCMQKTHAIHPKSTTRPLEVPHGPWESIGVDLITQLPKSQGYDAIIVFTDHFSKQIHALPCLTTINTEKIADIYY